MNKREWFVTGGFALYTLPFALVGGAILVAGLVMHSWMMAAIGGSFCLIAIAAVITKARAANLAIDVVTTVVKTPEEAWRVRPDWVQGRIWNSLHRMNPYDKAFCTLDHVPIHPGEHLRGTLEVPRVSLPRTGFRFKITHPLRSEKVVRSHAAVQTESGWRIPFDFLIPGNAPAMTPLLWSATRWQMNVSIDGRVFFGTIGVFDLPVFSAPPKAVITGEEARKDEATLSNALHRRPSAASAIHIATLQDGTMEISFRPNRGASAFAGIIGFLACWYAVVGLGLWQGKHTCNAVFFGILGLPMIFFGVKALVESTTIRVARDRIDHHLAGGLGKWKTVFAKDIARVEAPLGWQTSAGAQYDVIAIGHDDHITHLARGLRDKEDAEVIAARVWQALGHSL